MAKGKRNDPIIDAMVEAFMKLVEAMVVHSMGIGGPNAATGVIDTCITQMTDLKEQVIEVREEIEKEQQVTQETGV